MHKPVPNTQQRVDIRSVFYGQRDQGTGKIVGVESWELCVSSIDVVTSQKQRWHFSITKIYENYSWPEIVRWFSIHFVDYWNILLHLHEDTFNMNEMVEDDMHWVQSSHTHTNTTLFLQQNYDTNIV